MEKVENYQQDGLLRWRALWKCDGDLQCIVATITGYLHGRIDLFKRKMVANHRRYIHFLLCD